MARKWGSPGQKRALRKMLAARKRSLRVKRGAKSRRSTGGRKRTGTVRIKVKATRKRRSAPRRRNPFSALIANPGKPRRRRRKSTTTTGAKSMAKRRRKRASTKRRAAPRRARRVRMRGARRSTVVIYKNPSRRRRRRGPSRRRRVSRRRRNPSFRAGGLIKKTFVAFAAGFVTSGLAAVFDTQLARFPMGKRVAKLAVAFGIAHFGRKYPQASAAAIGSLAASEGYAMGMRIGGGMVAATPQEAVKGLAEMSDTYPEMGALLNGGVGALLNGVPNVDESVVDYETALSNTAGGMSYGDDYDDE